MYLKNNKGEAIDWAVGKPTKLYTGCAGCIPPATLSDQVPALKL